MSEFVAALRDSALLRNALIVGVLASLACGIVGSYVVARRITYIAGAVSHSVLGGMGVAKYFSVRCGWRWLHPLHGALLAALASAAIIGLASRRARQREDTVIAALWAVGMAIGVLFISMTPGYNEDLMGYLFGDILIVSPSDLWLVAALDIVVIASSLLFHNRLLAVCFDEEFARLRGIRVEFYYMLLLALTASTVVLLVTVVGIIMTIALLTLPAATAGQFAKTLGRMMVLSSLLCATFTVAGLAISWSPGLPAGATIVLVAAAAYMLALFIKHLRKHRFQSAGTGASGRRT